jgi:acyl carrier protein phosphodiesterase
VNFFAHALLAAEHNPEPAYVLGSMLPDFCTMAGVKGEATGHELVDAGVAHHHLVDDVFHPAPGFVEWMGEARDELEEEGVGLGPAMAVGHVGVELVLDGWLGERDRGRTPYRVALTCARERQLDLGSHSDRLHRLVHRLVDAPFPEGYVDSEFVAERLRRILAPRPRLALDDQALVAVKRWARRARQQAPTRAPQLMEQVRERLAKRVDFSI